MSTNTATEPRRIVLGDPAHVARVAEKITKARDPKTLDLDAYDLTAEGLAELLNALEVFACSYASEGGERNNAWAAYDLVHQLATWGRAW